jgi:hypothetical protein
MRYFTIPQAIHLINPSTKQQIGTPVTFRDHALGQWLSDRRWYQPMTRLARLVKVQHIFDAKENSKIALEDGDWEILKEIIQAPDMNIIAPNPMFQAQLLAFGDVVLNASEKSHEEQAKEAEEKAQADRAAAIAAEERKV